MSGPAPTRGASEGTGTGYPWALTFGFSVLLGFLLAASRHLLERKGDLTPADLILVPIVAGLAMSIAFLHDRAMSRAKARAFSGGHLPAPRKGPSWTDQIQQSHRLAWAMIAYLALTWFSTCVIVALPVFLRRQVSIPWPAFWSTLLAGAVWAWSFACLRQGAKLFHRLARRWVGPASSPGFGVTEPTTTLYDHELDHEFAPESRAVS